jgi:hypothetical protein
MAGISVCSGGIIGLGEKKEDRVGLIWEMSQMPEPPESFPVNALVPIEGTPLGGNEVRLLDFGFWKLKSLSSKSKSTTCFEPSPLLALSCPRKPPGSSHVRM